MATGYVFLLNDPEATMSPSRKPTAAPVAALRRCPCFLSLPLIAVPVYLSLLRSLSSGVNLFQDGTGGWILHLGSCISALSAQQRGDDLPQFCLDVHAEDREIFLLERPGDSR